MIKPEQLNAIASRIGEQVLNENVVSALRGEYPEIHFT